MTDITGTNGSDVLVGTNNADKISGLDSDDILDGGAGNDTLIGGRGFDIFRYNTGKAFTSADVGVDTINDFAVNNVNNFGADLFVLDKQTFTALKTIGGSSMDSRDFATVTSNAQAEISKAAIVYNSGTGDLFYNQNGSTSGFGTGGEFATLVGSPDNLSSQDFFVQA